MNGYGSAEYAHALAEFGTPRELSRSGGWLLEREIGESGVHDAMGCYPLFACRDWSRLGDDLDALQGQLVSVALVTDPFAPVNAEDLQRWFPDLCIPFKEHFVADLTRSPDQLADAHHRRNARRALEAVEVTEAADPILYLDEWVALYERLTARHDISDMRRFSRASFEAQLRVPGIVMLRAVRNGDAVGASLWYASGDVVYYHLGAYHDQGYELGASFAMFWRAIELFSHRGSKWMALGAGAGTSSARNDGLARFKRGWSTETRTAWFCGRVLNERVYTSLAKDVPPTTYFPKYRAGEFR